MSAKRSGPVTAGAIGLASLLASFVWAWLDSRAVHRSEQQMGWILDRTPPKGIGILAAYGVGVMLAALIWASVRTLRHRLAQRGKR